MLKALIRKPVGLFVLSWLIAAVVALTMVTIRWRTHNPENGQAILDDHDGFILVINMFFIAGSSFEVSSFW